ncbi:MAG: hypothetical protein V1929_04075 [bacterium]
MKTRYVRLFALFALLPACGPAFCDTVWTSKETLEQRAATENRAETQGTSRMEILRSGERIRVVEDRRQQNGTSYRFEVEFEPATLIPITWTRAKVTGEKEQRTELRVEGGVIETRTYTGNTLTGTHRIDTPGQPFCIVPLLRFQLALLASADGVTETIRVVRVQDDGAMAVDEVHVENLAEEDVTVPAGTFGCRRLRLTPLSWWMSTAVPPGHMYVATSGFHPLVKIVMSPTRISAPIITELLTYEVEQETAGPPAGAP